MRRTRNGPALFELLEEQSSLFKPLSEKIWRATRKPRTKSIDQPVPQPETHRFEITTDPQRSGSSWISLEGDRIRITFSSLTAAIVLFLFSLSLLLAFGWGARRGETRGLQRGLAAQSQASDPVRQDEISAVRERKPSSELIKDIAVGPQNPVIQASKPVIAPKELPAHSTAQEQAAPNWVKDRTYIVAQEMPASAMASAQTAQEFLVRGGVQTTIIKPNDRTLLLVTTHGYNHKDGAEKHQSEQLLDRIRALGTEFYAAGGGYKLEGYYRTLKRDAW
ncbi:MAG: hypothetical protein HY287_17660 [Planctomycetes bacterium]|nr:hypothetical protein [Planctomycetota bacterium]MBI3836150.1 hypothetical protein [Planctomycetota bacterium]